MRKGVDVQVVHPGLFPQKPLPKYPEIKLSTTPWHFSAHADLSKVDFVHIPTEGTLGITARIVCQRRKLTFSTAMHTKFPEYAKILVGVPESFGYRYLRWFHKPAISTIIQTPGQREELLRHGFGNLDVVGGGVDVSKFRPQPRVEREIPRLLFVGRVSKEKNIEAFLKLDISATKVVVGDGPDYERLVRKYPNVEFRGYRFGSELVYEYAQADCLVFTSKTDTFGLTSCEAMACGTPVAAYPVTGPIDVIREGVSGFLNDELDVAVRQCLTLDRDRVRQEALRFSWESVADRFLSVHRRVADSQISEEL